MRVFVMGASGYVGGAVARAFAAAGHSLTGLVRGPEKAARREGRGVRIGALALVLAAVPAGAQEEDGYSMASYRRARAEVEAGLAALGGPAPALSFTLEGSRGLRGQSAGPESAGERTPHRLRVMVEPARERALLEMESHLPGGIHFVMRRVAQGRAGFWIDVPKTRMGPALFELAAPAAAAVRTQAARTVPQLLLAQALARPATLRDLGTVTRDGRPHRAVAYATEEGAQVTLFLDSGTRLLSAYELLEDNAGVGDVLTEVRFADYADAAGVRLPTRYQVRQNGVVDQDLRYTAVAAGALPDSLFAAPAGYTPPPPAGAASVQTVAEGVYLLERLAGGYRSMFVDMGDHVLVVEAPFSSAASEAALGLIRQTLPGKPVRYVVVTHRHIDHIGGVRPYVAAGAVLVAPTGAEPALRDLAAVRRTLAAGPVDRAPGEPRIETVADRRVFQGAGRRVEVISTGGGSHVDSELVVYLPDQRLLYQGDFVTFPDYGGNAPDLPVTRELARLIRQLGLDV
ncbi:MAG TPA: MBL fold metallo-hydrolase, partial [Longimicrobium sp.]|nr:MBL fold metallo-hydrolase [Longimicrobium sp.]